MLALSERFPVQIIHRCANFSKAAYMTQDAACSFVNASSMPSLLQWFHIRSTGTRAFIAVVENEIYLSFQGTVAGIDLLTDLLFELVSSDIGGHCHRMFLFAAEADFFTIGRKIKQIAQGLKSPKIVITGHSLGGALAMVFSTLLKIDDPGSPVEHVITFGQPRCGNSEFAAAYNALDFNYLHFVNEGDIVPDVPIQLGKADWVHAGNGWIFASSGMRAWNPADETKATADAAILMFNCVAGLFQGNLVESAIMNEYLARHDKDLYLKNVLTYVIEQSSMRPQVPISTGVNL